MIYRGLPLDIIWVISLVSMVGDEMKYVLSRCENYGMEYDSVVRSFHGIIYAFFAYGFWPFDWLI
jgi:hypothetical protein